MKCKTTNTIADLGSHVQWNVAGSWRIVELHGLIEL
jgi:hypothetical protein